MKFYTKRWRKLKELKAYLKNRQVSIPNRVLVDFFSTSPLMITLNDLVHASRVKQSQNADFTFTDIFKIAVAYHEKLIEMFE